MKLNFKKIASVLASTVMLTSTIGFAAAANYPAPFSSSGGAVVYGAAAAKTDVVAAYKVEKSVTGTTTTTTLATSGETAPLYTGSSKINLNDTLTQVKTVLTKSELPTVLAKGTFSGNVDANYDQQIDIGGSSRFVFAKQPTTDDNPQFGISLGSVPETNPVYNLTVIFNKAVNFTHADSKNQEITMFGQKFTVGSGTDSTYLILFKSASKLNFDSTGTTSGEVTIDGKKYTLELVTASTTTATIAVTNEAGVSEQKEVTEGYSKKINGITIAINTADSNNQKYTASIIAGADKITLQSGSAVTKGDEGTSIQGTYVNITGGNTACTKFSIAVSAKDTDVAAINDGKDFVDPVFGTLKVSLAGLGVPPDSADRENITISPVGDNRLQVSFTDARGNSATVQYVKNWTTLGNTELQADDSGRNISVVEKDLIGKNEYVVVGNEIDGRLLQFTTYVNDSASTSDTIKFKDVFSGEEYSVSSISAEGTGSIVVAGKSYTVKYYGTSASTANVTIDSPDSSAAGSIIAYPTIKTSKGALVAFYKPLVIDLNDVDKGPAASTVASQIRIPDGDGFTDIDIVRSNATSGFYNITCGSATVAIETNKTTDGKACTIGPFTYWINGTATPANTTTLYLMKPDALTTRMTDPALIILEGKDDAGTYNGIVVTTDAGGTSDNGMGVDDIKRTWSADYTGTVNGELTLPSDSKKSLEADLFGTISLLDASDSDQKKATISYPESQVEADVYIGEVSSSISGGSSSGGTGALVAVEDSEITSVQDKNLVVVGGSCVNKAAAKILGSENPLCGADFTAKTQVGTGQYIIKTVKSPYNADKIAVLVAGYEAVDTQNAVDKLLTDKPATDADTSQVYPIVTATTA